MSINKAKLYIYYYGSFVLNPLFFTLVFLKGIFDSFFDALKETSELQKESKREFERRKTFTDNQ